MKSFIRNIFGLRKDMSISFYLIDFIFRKIFRQNAEVRWAIHHTSTIRCANNLKVGKETFPGDSPNVYIEAYNGVEIGDGTNLGPNVSIISSNHDFYDNTLNTPTHSIKIGKNCWLGSHVVILPEVILGDYCIVGAGSVVTKSFPDGYCVIVGNPARIVKLIDK